MNQSSDHSHPLNPDHVQAQIIPSYIKPNARASQTGASLVVSANLETEEEAVMVGLPKMETRLRDVLLQHQA